jgi:hypothetical protein
MHLEPIITFLIIKFSKKLNFIGAFKYVNLKKIPFCEFQLWFENKDWSYILKVPPYCLAKYTLICLDPNQFLSYFNWTWSKELKIIWIIKHNWISKQILVDNLKFWKSV